MSPSSLPSQDVTSAKLPLKGSLLGALLEGEKAARMLPPLTKQTNSPAFEKPSKSINKMGKAFIRMQVMILGQFGHALADLGRSQGIDVNTPEGSKDTAGGLNVASICAVLEPLRASAGGEGGGGGQDDQAGKGAADSAAPGATADTACTASAVSQSAKVSGKAALERLEQLAGTTHTTAGVKLRELEVIEDQTERLLRLSVWCYEEALLVLDPALEGYDGAAAEQDGSQGGAELSPIEWAKRLSQRLAAVSNEIGQHFISIGITLGQREKTERFEQSRTAQGIPDGTIGSCVSPFNQAMYWLSKALSTFEDPLVQDGQNSVLVHLNISKVMKLRAEFDWSLSMHEQHQLYQKAADECLAAKISMGDRKANAKANVSNTLLLPVSNELAMTYLAMGVKLGVKLLAARKERQHRQQINKVTNAKGGTSQGESDAVVDAKAADAPAGDVAKPAQQPEQQLEHMTKVIEFEALQQLEKDEQKVADTVIESLNRALQQYIELSAHDQIAATHFQMASFLRKWIIERSEEGQALELEQEQQRDRRQQREQRQLELTIRHYLKALQFFSQQRDLVKGTMTSDLTTIIVLHELCDLHEAVAISPVGTGGGGNYQMEHLGKALGYLLETRGPFSALAKPLPPPSCTQLFERVPKQRQSLNSVLLRLIHAAKQPGSQQHSKATAAIEKRVAAYKRMYRTALSGAQKNISELLLELDQLRPE
jgi:hypothetical protein